MQHTQKKRIDSTQIDTLKSRVDVVALVESYGVELRKAGAVWRGLCPFHGEKTPSFTVYQNTNSWHCFGCGADGDVVEFVKRAANIGFVGAVEKLSGGVLPNVPAAVAKQSKVEKWQDPKWQHEARDIVERAHDDLMQGRGTGPRVAADLLRRGITREAWQAFKLGAGSYLGAPAIVLPWHGKVIKGVKYRLVGGVGGDRYRSKAESEWTIFGAGTVRNPAPALLPYTGAPFQLAAVEGELNACALWTAAHDTGLDVVSFGSEKSKTTSELGTFAAKYCGGALIWHDSVNQIDGATWPSAFGEVASEANGKKQDACDLAALGNLEAVLFGWRWDLAGADTDCKAALLAAYTQAAAMRGVDENLAALLTKRDASISWRVDGGLWWPVPF